MFFSLEVSMRWMLVFSCLIALTSGCGDDTGGELLLGPSDDPAADACAQSTQSGDPVMAQTDRASVVMTVLGAAPSPYLVQLPDGAPGFIALNVPEAHHDWAFFTRPQVEVTSFTAADGTDLPALTPTNNGACDGAGIVDYRFHRHIAGHVVVEFSAESLRSVWLMFAQADSGGPGDGGMHPGDGGA
jgi:hypothetical protein